MCINLTLNPSKNGYIIPRETDMTVENPPFEFEDIFDIEDGIFPAIVIF